MALTHVCATGQLPSTVAALYTAAAPGTFTVHVSNGANARTVNIYVNPGTRRRISARNQALATGAAWPPNGPYGPIHLDTGDSIDGDADAANEVDWVITGIEKS
jgi:hypothetical protein